MHDGDDDDAIVKNSEQNAKREYLGQTSPDVKIHDGIETGINDDAIDGVLDGGKEFFTEILLLTLIVRRSRNHLRLGEGMKPDLCHVSFE